MKTPVSKKKDPARQRFIFVDKDNRDTMLKALENLGLTHCFVDVKTGFLSCCFHLNVRRKDLMMLKIAVPITRITRDPIILEAFKM